jgi:hypothetical protein
MPIETIEKPMTFDEWVIAESRKTASDVIEAELEKQGLPLPKDSALDAHIDALLASRPDILDSARVRVEAKSDAYSAALRAIGITPILIEALDLDIDP